MWTFILFPIVFNFNNAGKAYLTAVIIAVIICTVALLSCYELSIFKILSMRLHFWFDSCVGGLLALSPWLFGFSEKVFKPHLVLGLSLIVVSLLTDRLPAVIVFQLLGRGKKRMTDSGKQRMNNFQFIYERGSDFLIRHVRKVLRIPFR